MSSVLKIIALAYDELGYLEKASNKSLDSKTANAGHNNYTKYWRDMSPALNGSYWCDVFIDWLFVKAYGEKEAQRLECGGTYCYYTKTSAQYYKDAGQWSRTPKIGAQIFFENTERINHTGLVVAFDDTTVTTIEGNTADGNSVISNGGAVCKKTYARNNSRIAGYGCPKYTEGEIMFTTKQFLTSVANVQKMARDGHFKYGDSHSVPPCADKIISCDRLIARALWDLGYTDQPRIPNSTSGITVENMDSYLVGKKGWKKITNKADLLPGDCVVTKINGKPEHTFVLTAYDPKTEICSKYDEGADWRISSVQPFKNVPLIEPSWKGSSFYYAVRVPGSSGPKRLPTKGTARTITTALNKSYSLDIAGGSMNNGANVQIYKSNGTDAQKFIIEDMKDGFVRIIVKKSGLVLDVKAGKAQNGQNVQQYEWNGTKAQLFKMRLNADMTVTFESAINPAYVLDVKGGKAANKTNVQLYKNNGTKAQRFIIT